VIVPLRSGPGFPATLKLTVPLPMPDEDPPLIVMNEALLEAVHAQPPPAVTVVLPEPGPGANDCAVGESE
jgi:hypothetical protein